MGGPEEEDHLVDAGARRLLEQVVRRESPAAVDVRPDAREKRLLPGVEFGLRWSVRALAASAEFPDVEDRFEIANVGRVEIGILDPDDAEGVPMDDLVANRLKVAPSVEVVALFADFEDRRPMGRRRAVRGKGALREFATHEAPTVGDEPCDGPRLFLLLPTMSFGEEPDAGADRMAVRDDDDARGSLRLDLADVAPRGKCGGDGRRVPRTYGDRLAAREKKKGQSEDPAHRRYHGRGSMMRQVVLAFVFLACVDAAVAQELVRRESGRDAGTVTLVSEPRARRLTGTANGASLRVVLELDARGDIVAYDREIRDPVSNTVLRASVTPQSSGWLVRESGPLGVARRTVWGQAFDTVFDPAAPEIAVIPLLDRSRRAFRALDLESAEIRTVVIEDRLGGARFADAAGGGFTAWFDDAGLLKLVLPGSAGRMSVRRGADSRPGRLPGSETRLDVKTRDGFVLAAVLARPTTLPGPFPLCVLLPDDGPRDRDGLGPDCAVPVLATLADQLAALGIATIRADGRGAGESTGPPRGLDGLADDALALAEAAVASEGIDPRRVTMLGHAFGGVTAVEAARRKPDIVATVVLLGIPATPLAEALETRLRTRLFARGEREEGVARAVDDLRASLARLRALPKDAPCPPELLLLRDLASFDPAEQLAALRQPMLVLHGSHDLEVPMNHVARLRAPLAFTAGGRVTFRLVEPLDHDLLTAIPGRHPVPGSADVARAPHPDVPRHVAAFLKAPSTR